MKRLIAALLAGLTLFALVGCSAGSKADSAAPKDYSQILHDARTDEENEYDMIFTKGEDGKFTAIDGYSAEYERPAGRRGAQHTAAPAESGR